MSPEGKNPRPTGGEVEEGLTIQGDLRESSLATLLRSLIQNRETGTLKLTRFEFVKSIHLKEGRIVFATSTDPDDRLGEVLLRKGLIGLEQYFESSKQIRPGKRQGSILVELGYISPDELINGIREQVEEIVYSMFRWTRGEYEVVLEEPDAQDLITLNLSTENLIYEGVRRVPEWSRILNGIGSSMDTVFARSPDSDGIVYRLDLTEDESHLFGLLNGKLTVAQVCAMSYLTNFESCRALWGFQAVGAAIPVGAMDAQAAMKVELEEIEEVELREVLERYGKAIDLVAGDLSSSLGGDAVEPFLQSSLRQIRGHYPMVLEGVELEESKLETGVIIQNIATLPSAERSERVGEAMNELIYAVLLHVKMKLGIEVERRLSDRVARVLESVD